MRKLTGFDWVQFLIGILMVIMGVFSFLHPGKAMTGFVWLYAAIAVILGCLDIVLYIRAERYVGFGPILSLVAGIISVMIGIMLFTYPNAGKAIISLMFPIWFISHCVSHLLHLHVVKTMYRTVSYYFLLVINILGLLLGILMLVKPIVSLLTAEVFIGGYLLITGIDCMTMAIRKSW